VTNEQEQHLRELAAEAEKAECATDTFAALRELQKAVLAATAPKPNDIGHRVATLIAPRNSGYTSVHRLAVAEAINIQRADAAKAEKERCLKMLKEVADQRKEECEVRQILLNICAAIRDED
jgi:hypothetical protein